MKPRYLLVAALLAFATPLHAQELLCPWTPAQTGGASYRVAVNGAVVGPAYARIDTALRAANTLETANPRDNVSVVQDLDLRVECPVSWTAPASVVDTIRLPGDTVLIVDTVYVAQPTPDDPSVPSDDVPPPPPDTTSLPPDTTTTPPPPAGPTRRSLPAGWAIISDYGFDDPPPSMTGYYEGQPLGSSGWLAQDWNVAGATELQRVSDPTAPGSQPYALAETYPPHLSGGGTTSFVRTIPTCRQVYISWVVKWDAGFHHNGNSEKQLYFNFGDSNYFLFQFHWGSEAIYNIRPDPNEPRQAQINGGDNSLRANLMPSASNGLPFAPPIDGEWVEYEFIFEQQTGRVRWWLNGVQHADHVGRSFPAVRHLKFSTTWGGGGDKQGTHRRYTDDVLVACRA